MNTKPTVSTTIFNLLKQHEKFVLFVHENPDCDALGSAFALLLSLTQQGKQVHIAGINEKIINKFAGVFPFELISLTNPT